MIDEICEWTGRPVYLCEGHCCWPGLSQEPLQGGYLVEPFVPDLPAEVPDTAGAPASLLGFPVRETDENLPADFHIRFGTLSEYDRDDIPA